MTNVIEHKGGFVPAGRFLDMGTGIEAYFWIIWNYRVVELDFLERQRRKSSTGGNNRLVSNESTQLLETNNQRPSNVVYRYASLFFICGVDQEENELIVLEVIHRYVEVGFCGDIRAMKAGKLTRSRCLAKPTALGSVFRKSLHDSTSSWP